MRLVTKALAKILILNLLSVSIFASMSVGKTIVEIKKQVLVNKKVGSKIQLSDIADLNGLPVDVRQLISSIYFGATPEIGQKRILTRSEISKILRKKTNNQFQFKIPLRISVTNEILRFSVKNVRTALIKRWKKMCPACKFEFESVNLPRLVKDLKVESWHIGLIRKLPRSSFSLPVRLQTNFGSQTYWLSGNVETHLKVPVLKRSVNYGELLKKPDLEMIYRNVTYSRDSPASIEELVGMKVKRTMSSQQIVWRKDVERLKALRRGDLVEVVYGSDNWQVSMVAIAQEDGYVGDKISLRNPNTKKLISGIVAGKSKVRVQ